MKVLHLEITCIAENRLKTSLSSRTFPYRDTLQAFEETQVGLEGVTRCSRQMLAMLDQANRNGHLSPNLLQSLKETGQLLRDELLTTRLKEKLNTSDAHYLTISLDEQLVHIPWELLHDGRQFLCQRFAVGRLVQTRQKFPGVHANQNQGPLRMLILADLDGSLPSARREGTQIRDFIESLSSGVQVMMRSANVGSPYVRTTIRRYDWVHFAGHADYGDDSIQKKGWRLSKGWFTAEDVNRMAGTGAMPTLVFANACQSARTDAWSLDHTRQRQFFGLVNAFLAAGTQHYLGTSWEIPDEPGRFFALTFYRRLAEGATVGRAVVDARKKLIEAYGEEQVIWASYVLYGDPAHRYVVGKAEDKVADRTHPISGHPAMPLVSASATRAAERPTRQERRPYGFRGRKGIVLVVLAALAGAMLIAVMFSNRPPRVGDELQQQAMAAFRAGDFERVLDICPPPSAQSTPLVGCLLLRANVMFAQGNLADAGTLYGLASESSHALKIESAEGLIGLGRIASTRNQFQQAMDLYRQAANAAPGKKEPLVALAVLNERLGKDREALTLLETAEHVGPPNDPTIETLRRSLSAKIALKDDTERMQRIDRLIDELTRSPSD
ncbi:MAG: CHAT domain-containing protein, partial [Desulfosarcina sp.]